MTLLTRPGDGPAFPYAGRPVHILAGQDGLRYPDWSMRRPDGVSYGNREFGYRFLRSKANSIEGGTSEVLRNIVAERVLGLPAEPRVDKDVPWKDLPR